ncbi:MAG TPA: hypothetical protein VKQ30_20925 [Ktedonobacterales bacterium]|nr:hypothetical protein [Ktedonobacterales bacterium]
MIDPSYLQSEPYVRYDPATGEITACGQVGVGFVNDWNTAGTGSFFPDYGTCDAHWFDTSVFKVTPKGNCPATLSGASLINCPVPSKLTISQNSIFQQTYDVTESTVDLSFEHPGTYQLVLKSPKFLTAQFTVTI